MEGWLPELLRSTILVGVLAVTEDGAGCPDPQDIAPDEQPQASAEKPHA